MKDENKTREQLIDELVKLRQCIVELEKSESERKRAEEELRKHRDHLGELVEERTAQLQEGIAERIKADEGYKTLIENSLQGLAVFQDYTVIFVNTALAEMLGYNVEELTSLSPKEVRARIHPEDQKLVWGRYRDRLEGKPVPPRYDFRIIRKDGTICWVEMFSSLIDYGGKPAIQAAFIDITERKKAEEALQRKREEMQTIIDSVPAYIFYKDREGRHIYVNKALADAAGIPKEKWVGKTISELLPKLAERYTQDDEEVMSSGQPKMNIIEPFETPEGIRWAQTDKIPIKDKKGNVIGLTASAIDITERRVAEEKIKSSLKEKEVMLREIHHRVRNNMQIMSSLLRLQSVKIKDKKIQEMFKASQTRIRSMALIHEKLYQSKDLARINFAQYIQSLTVHLFQTYRVDTNIIKLKTDMEDVFLDINTAIPCSLIINELISNSLKYAFPKGKKGGIGIKLHKNKQGKVTFIVSDDGVGLPEDIDFRNPDSLGLQIVNDLVKQIGGAIKLRRFEGTEFKIRF